MRYIKAILGILMGLGIVYTVFTVAAAELNPFEWDEYLRAYVAMYVLCVFIINIMFFASYEKETTKKKVERRGGKTAA